METTELRAAIEAILFVSNEPVSLDDLVDAFSDEGRDAVVAQLEEIKRNLDANVGGFMLEQTAGGYRLATRAEHEPVLKKYFARKGESRLSIAALETLRPDDLEKTITIRGEAFLVFEALNRSVTHTAYHVGQIVYLARHLAAPNWTSLSIPKGKSSEFSKGNFKGQSKV